MLPDSIEFDSDSPLEGGMISRIIRFSMFHVKHFSTFAVLILR